MSKVVPISITLSALADRVRTAFIEVSAAAGVLRENSYIPLENANLVFANGTYKSTTVSLGTNPAVGSKPLLVPPTITSGEIGTDGINNPYTTINFQIDQKTIDGNSIVAFKLYRQEVPAEDLAQEVETFTKADFDKIAQKSPATTQFSADTKAAYTINEFKQSQVNLNENLYALQSTANQQQFGTIAADPNATGYPDYFTPPVVRVAGPTQLLATINYQQAEDLAKLKQVYVQQANTVSLSYTDNNVSYGSGYIYTLTSFCSTSDESSPSESISMVVLNLKGINKPLTAQVKQKTTAEAAISLTVDPADLVKFAYIYKRNIEDLIFHPLAVVGNLTNSMTAYDDDIDYMNSYVYRILLENVFGVVSEPLEVTFTATSQNVISRTRSNNLKLPIILASQDQNSDGIKITIFPNDQRVLYYKLERINVTIGERLYSVPNNDGIEFWPTNQFFVQPLSGSTITTGSLAQIVSGSLPPQSQFINFSDPIEFVDTVVTANNYYQYRISGYDLYGNNTGYGFAAISAQNKNTLRSPVNFGYEVLRESPFRIKLTWKDDNEASIADQNNTAQQRYLQIALQQANLSQQQQNLVYTMTDGQDLSKVDLSAILAPYNVNKAILDAIESELKGLSNISNPLNFQLQRRKSGDTVYSSFPYTQNSFVVDEVPCADAIPFSTGLLSGSPQPTTSSVVSSTSSLSRSFGLPDFLQDQQVYQYRVAALTLDGAMSDFCAPITVIASAQISQPVGFSASLLNPKVTPCVVRLEWAVDPLKNKPDHTRIERKANVPTEDYVVIGNSYLDNVYFDRSAQTGLEYSYRIRSVSAVGDESDIEETSIVT